MRSVCPRRRPRFWKVQRTRCFILETVFRLSSTLDDFCFIFVSVWDKIFYCFRNVFFALLFVLFCLTFINLCGWFCLCNFDFVEWKYLLFSLHFDCNVLFLFYDMSIWCVFCFILNFWKHFAFSRECWTLINGLKMKKVKVVICIVLLFILLSLCLCVLLGNLTITSSGHFALSFLLQCLIFICYHFRDTFSQLYFFRLYISIYLTYDK